MKPQSKKSFVKWNRNDSPLPVSKLENLQDLLEQARQQLLLLKSTTGRVSNINSCTTPRLSANQELYKFLESSLEELRQCSAHAKHREIPQLTKSLSELLETTRLANVANSSIETKSELENTGDFDIDKETPAFDHLREEINSIMILKQTTGTDSNAADTVAEYLDVFPDEDPQVLPVLDLNIVPSQDPSSDLITSKQILTTDSDGDDCYIPDDEIYVQYDDIDNSSSPDRDFDLEKINSTVNEDTDTQVDSLRSDNATDLLNLDLDERNTVTSNNTESSFDPDIVTDNIDFPESQASILGTESVTPEPATLFSQPENTENSSIKNPEALGTSNIQSKYLDTFLSSGDQDLSEINNIIDTGNHSISAELYNHKLLPNDSAVNSVAVIRNIETDSAELYDHKPLPNDNAVNSVAVIGNIETESAGKQITSEINSDNTTANAAPYTTTKELNSIVNPRQPGATLSDVPDDNSDDQYDSDIIELGDSVSHLSVEETDTQEFHDTDDIVHARDRSQAASNSKNPQTFNLSGNNPRIKDTSFTTYSYFEHKRSRARKVLITSIISVVSILILAILFTWNKFGDDINNEKISIISIPGSSDSTESQSITTDQLNHSTSIAVPAEQAVHNSVTLNERVAITLSAVDKNKDTPAASTYSKPSDESVKVITELHEYRKMQQATPLASSDESDVLEPDSVTENNSITQAEINLTEESISTANDWAVNLLSFYKNPPPEDELQPFRKLGAAFIVRPVHVRGRRWYRMSVIGFESKQSAGYYANVLRKKTKIDGIWISREINLNAGLPEPKGKKINDQTHITK